MQKNIIVIYHAQCADGFGAAWAARKALGETADFHAAIYGQPLPDVIGRHVFFLDFTPDGNALLETIETARSVTVLDHHESAAPLLRDLFSQGAINGKYAPDKSGAGLAWEHFHPEAEVPMLIQYIQDRDLWLHKIDGTRDFYAFLSSYPFDFAVWDEIAISAEDPAGLLIMKQQGAVVDRARKMEIANLIPMVTRLMQIGGHVVQVANLPKTMASDAAGALAHGVPFAACYCDERHGRVFSLRSRPEGINVFEIARKYGGGGHARAAGFTMPHGWDGDGA